MKRVISGGRVLFWMKNKTTRSLTRDQTANLQFDSSDQNPVPPSTLKTNKKKQVFVCTSLQRAKWGLKILNLRTKATTFFWTMNPEKCNELACECHLKELIVVFLKEKPTAGRDGGRGRGEGRAKGQKIRRRGRRKRCKWALRRPRSVAVRL